VNYIKRLEAENAEKANRLDAVAAELSEFRKHIDLPKFKGTDEDGDRKDWIATADVCDWIEKIRIAHHFGTLYDPAPDPTPCGHCGEADNSKGAHGIGRCAAL
jgi:hypothetical protein